MDNLTKQIEEIEALRAIYDEEFQVEDEINRAFSIKISSMCHSNLFVKLYFQLPDNYPSTSPPIFEISAPHLSHNEKEVIDQTLQNIYLLNIGENIIFQWIEKIREVLDSRPTESDELQDVCHYEKEISIISDDEDISCPEIIHGEVILDRKSTFQGHTARVSSINQIKQVIKKLKQNRKIQQATHNMYAYRIYDENKKCFIHDCDDDGETQAGSRLLHLLEIMNTKNVIVIVSRWYGGIHLGPDRFKHINNAARQVLSTANFIS